MPPLLIGLVLVVAGMDNAEGESPLGSPRPFGQGKASRAEEFDRTGVLQPESQITAALRPGILSEFYYLIHHEGKPFTLLVSPCTGPISWTVSYTRPPENESDAEGARSEIFQHHPQWPMTKLVPGSPLFAYSGTEARNFTMMRAPEGLYRFEIKSETRGTNDTAINRGVDTVLLYATTESPDRLSIVNFGSGKRHRRNLLKFHQRRSKRRLGISWNWSRAGPNLTEYCLAVTSGQLKPPATLCAARNLLVLASTGPSDHPENSGHRSQRPIPEGLHCPREPRLTLNGMRFNTTYHFALYAVSKTNNVSSRVATNSHKFRRTPTQSLRTGNPETVNLLKNSGLAIFQYRPRSNMTTVFLMRSCYGGSFRVLLKGPGGVVKDEEVVDRTLKLEAEPLQPGKRYILRISATQKELEKVSTVKIVARENVASIYQKTPNRTRSRGNNRFPGGSSWSRSTQRFKIDRRPICSLSDV